MNVALDAGNVDARVGSGQPHRPVMNRSSAPWREIGRGCCARRSHRA